MILPKLVVGVDDIFIPGLFSRIGLSFVEKGAMGGMNKVYPRCIISSTFLTKVDHSMLLKAAGRLKRLA